MIKFKSISSGSCGNSYFLGIQGEEGIEASVLIDTGISMRRVKTSLLSDGIKMDSIDGILISHDHWDHVHAIGSYCKHLCIPVWTTKTLKRALIRKHTTGEFFPGVSKILEEGWNEIVPGRISVRYFIVPHDATQTVGYAIRLDGHLFVIMTDTGSVTEEASGLASAADTVVIESNYDPEMLKNGNYPPELQDRISGGHGHLSNGECAEAIRGFMHDGLRQVFLCHLSEQNNTPELARNCSLPVCEENGCRLVVLPRENPSPMFTLE